MKIRENIDSRLEEIYKEFKQDKEDLTAWSVEKKIKKEADFEEVLIEYLIYRLMRIAFNQKEIIVPLLQKFLIYNYFEEKISFKNESDSIEIFPKVYLIKGIKTKIFERIGFKKTLNAYYNYLLCNEEEINEKNYLSENQINQFCNWEKASEKIIAIFKEELEEKFGKNFHERPRIIKI